MRNKVYLVWLHDMILGTFWTRKKAEARMADYRQAQSGNWTQLPGGRWVMEWDGHGRSISRLEIEEVTPK